MQSTLDETGYLEMEQREPSLFVTWWLEWVKTFYSHLLLCCLFQVAVCNLASIALNMYVKDRTFDFEKLRNVTKVIVRNLNKIIEVNFYPGSRGNQQFKGTKYLSSNLAFDLRGTY